MAIFNETMMNFERKFGLVVHKTFIFQAHHQKEHIFIAILYLIIKILISLDFHLVMRILRDIEGSTNSAESELW